jgi:hypothetical protein
MIFKYSNLQLITNMIDLTDLVLLYATPGETMQRIAYDFSFGGS